MSIRQITIWLYK